MKMKLSSLELNKLSLFKNDDGDIFEVEEVLASILGDVSSEDPLLNLPITFSEKYSWYLIGVSISLSLAFNLNWITHEN